MSVHKNITSLYILWFRLLARVSIMSQLGQKAVTSPPSRGTYYNVFMQHITFKNLKIKFSIPFQIFRHQPAMLSLG